MTRPTYTQSDRDDARETGVRIYKRRTEIGMTQAELAGHAGVHFQAISAYESGKQMPLLATLVRICRALKTDPNTLLGWTR